MSLKKRAKSSSTELLLAFDTKDDSEYNYIIYVDEAGRGCLAGPVYVGAVVWPQIMEKDDVTWKSIRDSKKLTKKKRETLVPYIEKVAYTAVGTASVSEIDEHNILNATFMAMHRAISQVIKYLGPHVTADDILLCIDGNSFKPYMHQGTFLSHICIPQGDDTYVGIAAASILAKVKHDHHIRNLCVKDPSLNEKYGWIKNVCYGTKQHRDGIAQHGLTSYHRTTFGNYGGEKRYDHHDKGLSKTFL
jgi:ribonuclease HII